MSVCLSAWLHGCLPTSLPACVSISGYACGSMSMEQCTYAHGMCANAVRCHGMSRNAAQSNVAYWNVCFCDWSMHAFIKEDHQEAG